MPATSCAACDAPLPDTPIRAIGGKLVCSPSCAGFILTRKTEEIVARIQERKTKPLKRGIVPISPDPVPITLPAGMTTKPSKTAGWGRVQIHRNVWHIDEITILMKVHPDSEVQVFGYMRNVEAYSDPKFGLLLRPNEGGVKETFDDFPRAISAAKKSPYRRRHPEVKTQGDHKADVPSTKPTPVRPERKVVAEASYGNLQEDPTSKRFWLIESMTRGGTAKEIVKRAAGLAVKNGYFESEDDFLDKMPSNYMAIKKMFDWWKVKLNQARIAHRMLEAEGSWIVELVQR
jgi:hypothetical protein